MTRRAFTILEVLIGLSLLIVLVAGAYGLLLQLHTRQQEVARLAARNTIGTIIIDAAERAVLTCVADAGADGPGVSLTDSTLRIVYRDLSPDMPPTDDAFSTRARLAIIHHPDARTAEVTVTHGARAPTTTIANIERIRFRAHDGDDWLAEFDSRVAGRLPVAIEVAVWFATPGASMPAGDEDAADEPRAWREPDRLRVIAVFDCAAEEPSVIASGGDGAAEEGGTP